MWSRREKMHRAAEDWFFWPIYKSGFVARVHDGYKSLDRGTIGTCHDQHAVGIEVGSEYDFRTACLPSGRCFRDLRDSAGRDPNSVARWTSLVLVA